MRYRQRVDIIADILKIAANGAKKTRIMYMANLSYRLLQKYLEDAINVGFVEANDTGYGVTEKGRTFLDKYQEISKKYSSVERTIQEMKFERETLQRMCEQRGNPDGNRGAETQGKKNTARTRNFSQ